MTDDTSPKPRRRTTPAKKTTTARSKPVKKATRRPTKATTPAGATSPSATVSLSQLGEHIQQLAGTAARTAGATAQQSLQSAGKRARELSDKGRRYLRERPGEAVSLAAAGLTVAAAVFGGRRKLGPVFKTLVASGLVAKAGQAAERWRRPGA